LQVVYEHVHQSTEGMEDVISRQKEIFAMKKAERQQMLEAIEREEQEATQDLSGEVSEVPGETLPDKPPA
jgi:hypothetical protein